MGLTSVYWALAAGLALAYGAARVRDRPSLSRTMIKSLSIAILAAIVFVQGGPLLLVAALALCAIGDGFLAQSPRWLKPGMAAFAAGHLAYVVLFVNLGGGVGPDVLRIVLQIALLGFAAYFYNWLKPSLGDMRTPVGLYFGVILLMALLALGLPHAHWLATIGALLFLASDGLLAGELFKFAPNDPRRAYSSYAVWALYWLGQGAITAGVLYPAR
jgi:uncharacterized membrane protein YhhN